MESNLLILSEEPKTSPANMEIMRVRKHSMSSGVAIMPMRIVKNREPVRMAL